MLCSGMMPVDSFERAELVYASDVEARNSHSEDAAGAEEYQRLRRQADEARIDAELARLELEKHSLLHTQDE